MITYDRATHIFETEGVKFHLKKISGLVCISTECITFNLDKLELEKDMVLIYGHKPGKFGYNYKNLYLIRLIEQVQKQEETYWRVEEIVIRKTDKKVNRCITIYSEHGVILSSANDYELLGYCP